MNIIIHVADIINSSKSCVNTIIVLQLYLHNMYSLVSTLSFTQQATKLSNSIFPSVEKCLRMAP